MGLLHQSLGGIGESVAFKKSKRERITRIIDSGANECVSAFPHQTCVWSKNQDNRLAGIWLRHKLFDLGGLERNHADETWPRSGSGYEIGCKARPDIVGYQLGSAIFRFAKGACPGKPLGLTWNVIGYTGKSCTADHRLARLDVIQGIIDVEAIILDIRSAAVDVHNDRKAG